MDSRDAERRATILTSDGPLTGQGQEANRLEVIFKVHVLLNADESGGWGSSHATPAARIRANGGNGTNCVEDLLAVSVARLIYAYCSRDSRTNWTLPYNVERRSVGDGTDYDKTSAKLATGASSHRTNGSSFTLQYQVQ